MSGSVYGSTITLHREAAHLVTHFGDADLDDVALRHADIAMYHAKYHGGDRHTVYAPGMVMPTGQPRRGPRLRDLRQHRRGVTR